MYLRLWSVCGADFWSVVRNDFVRESYATLAGGIAVAYSILCPRKKFLANLAGFFAPVRFFKVNNIYLVGGMGVVGWWVVGGGLGVTPSFSRAFTSLFCTHGQTDGQTTGDY